MDYCAASLANAVFLYADSQETPLHERARDASLSEEKANLLRRTGMSESLAVRRKTDGEGGAPRPVAAAKCDEPMARVNAVLNGFAERNYHGEVLTAVRRFPAREAEFAEWPEWVRTELRAAYAPKGIARP